jgi:hypothetical protein
VLVIGQLVRSNGGRQPISSRSSVGTENKASKSASLERSDCGHAEMPITIMKEQRKGAVLKIERSEFALHQAEICIGIKKVQTKTTHARGLRTSIGRFGKAASIWRTAPACSCTSNHEKKKLPDRINEKWHQMSQSRSASSRKIVIAEKMVITAGISSSDE